MKIPGKFVCALILGLGCQATGAAKDELPMRDATEKDLTFQDGTKEKVPYPESAIINERGMISIIPGEELAVRFERDGDKLVRPKLEKDAAKQGDCVIFKCKHEDGHLSLVVKNPYDRFLHYRCGTIQRGNEEDARIEGRRNLPVSPKLICYEAYSGKELILFFSNFLLHDTYQGPAPAKETEKKDAGKKAEGEKKK